MDTIKELQNEVNNQQEYRFTTDTVSHSITELKGDKQHFITGYIAVPEIDLENDLMTPEALKSMLHQIQTSNITLDYEHEAFRDDPSILAAGKIVEAKVDDKGLWVKCQLNKHSPKFKNLWGSIKDGFVNAFSVAFKPLKTITKTIDGVKVRLIQELKLLNTALTGTPMSPGSKMTGHSMKSVMLKAIEDTKEDKVLVTKSLVNKLMEVKMEEEKKIESEVVEEVKEEATEVKEEVKEAEPEVKVEEKSEEAEEEKEKEEIAEKALAELTANVKELKEANEKLTADLKSLGDKEEFKSVATEAPELKSEDKKINMLSLV